MPRTYVKKLGGRSYKNYTKATLAEAVHCVVTNKLTYRKASEKYGIAINTIVLNVKKVKASVVVEDARNMNLNNVMEGLSKVSSCGGQTVLTLDEEKIIVSHVVGMSNYGFPVSTTDLRVIVSNYLTNIGRTVKRFKQNMPGHDWVERFLKRHPAISSRIAKNISLGRASTTRKEIVDFFDHLKREIEEVPPENIFNFDETNVVDDPGSSKVLVKRGTKYPERVMNSTKACTTLMICGNAAGETIPPYVIYKAEGIYDTWKEGGPPGTRYNRSKSGWIDSVIFSDWFEFHLLPILQSKPGKKVIISDNLSSHFNHKVLQLCADNNIRFVALPPNATHLLQPLDVAFFRPMKGEWRSILGEWKNSPYGRRCGTIPKSEFPKLLKVMMDNLEARSCSNLMSGFRKCGIHPFDPTQVLNRLHDSVMNSQPEHVENIGQSFMNHLSKTREDTVQATRRKKRLNLPPGKGITAEDMAEARPVPAKKKKEAAKKNEKQTKKKSTQNAEKVANRRKISIDSDSEDDDISISLHDSEDSLGFDISSSENDPEFRLDLHQSSIDDGQMPCSSKSLPKQLQNTNPDCELGQESNQSGYLVGDYVVAMFEGSEIPGKVMRFDEPDYEVLCMQKIKNHWKWPKNERLFWFGRKNILGKISEPKLLKGGKEKIYAIELHG